MCLKWLVIIIIASITWIAFIGEQAKLTGLQLYEQGLQLYMENSQKPLPPVQKNCTLEKYIEQNKCYE